MNNNFCLRKATNHDLDALFTIYMDASINRFLNFEIMNKESFKEIFEDLMQSGDLFVFSNDHHIAATCIVMKQKRRAQHVASLGTLATHPDFQRKGVGTQFMKELFKKLKNDGIKRIDLCVESDNPIAQKFYEKLGFQREGILKKYFKRPYENHFLDEYMMAIIFE